MSFFFLFTLFNFYLNMENENLIYSIYVCVHKVIKREILKKNTT